ncbi:DUF4387 domain-containing protein [Tetragenococcus koreensis]|uniref:DUF4387 domain-containing protein n=1 Tax=Tetragenococcus koreensis TaxID=290335 RepID=UPI001F1E276A|nr:DUF4387 domain-containing protein [Tetragenococcus koreensis]MCF1627444.1 DUF4387 domain-containing protein [Tetragenococcus koreensis]MDN6289040.1 DUF4387 domain-containing protein [Tetragenococcus koreensis]MDN6471133.1 DUF4387 domain-containing protein [Tetragenococcus koreensis]MDN6663703.1 DUF4387 domain-containing protein [Tetragenococcus koreensis]
MIKLQDYARVIRSKNSGPFELTFDILFDNLEDYEHFVASKVLTKESFAKLYQIEVDDIITFEHVKPARGIKITIPRPWSQGSVGESDMHGSQQYASLLSIEIPEK